ncbi:MAG: isochorismatase family protein [Planctomycetales bacterium]|nr:isochorismatase family protein [Planctomycetales bacterium]
MPSPKRRHLTFSLTIAAITWIAATSAPVSRGQEPSAPRVYHNTLTPLQNPQPLLAEYPEFVQPISEMRRFEAPILIDDNDANLSVRAWRFSYNARGIIEIPNRLNASKTAVIMVHPWGVDDGQGWRTPQPAGAADFCTEEKNHLAGKHTREVIDPLLKRLRPQVGLVMYSLIGSVDPIRKRLYRTIDYRPTAQERADAAKELKAKLNDFDYRGKPLPKQFPISSDHPVGDYFKQFPGLTAGDEFNGKGFWSQPVPIHSSVTVEPEDVLIFDVEGYEKLKKFLQQQGIRHVLLTGYATDMCFCRTTAGYENLSRDFNVFLVGDATLATFPANATPRYATNAHISFASLNQLVTQVSWIKEIGNK